MTAAALHGNRRLTAALLSVALGGCFLPPLRPRVHLEPGVSLTSYRVFDVGRVVDESGWPFPYEITDSLRRRLVQRLREHGYEVTVRDSAGGRGDGAVLRIESRLTAFRSGGLGFMQSGPRTRCWLASTLIDGSSGRRVGEIFAAEDDELAPFAVLMRCARIVADEIDRRVRGGR